MSNDADCSATELSCVAGSVTRMGGGIDIEAGSYWTALVTVDFSRERSIAASGDAIFRNGKPVDEGTSGGPGLIRAGRTHLVARLKLAEGEIHTVVLLGHPEDEAGAHYEILVGDFMTWFAPEHDAQAIRAREMKRLEARVAGLQKEIVERQDDPDLDAELIMARGMSPSSILPAGPDIGVSGKSLVMASVGVTQRQIDDARARVEVQAVLAEEKAKWLTVRTEEIGETLATMGAFYKERAVAALARTQDMQRSVRQISAGLKTLGLYTGEGIDVRILRDGAEAPTDEDLTVFQGKIYLDEETLINHALGGADFRDTERFAEILRDDRSMLERILPMPRCVVLAQWRRSDKKYGENIFVDLERNEANRLAFLLIRNGERVYQVFSEVATANSHLLFPTEDEIAHRPFRGTFGERITIDNVQYSEALEAQQEAILHYRRLLILLWGLNDRLALLGSGFHVDGRDPKFMSMEFQEKRFRFIADAEPALPAGRQDLHKWIVEKNSHLKSGSRVLCLWKGIIDPASAPSCFGRKDGAPSHARRYWPQAPFETLIAFRDGPDIVVRTEVAGYGRATGEMRHFLARVALSGDGYNEEGELGFLVLDAVSVEDLDWYLNSRFARRKYLSYVTAFAAARNMLLAELEGERAMREALAGDVRDGLKREGAEVASAIDGAVQTWRAAHRGARVPSQSGEPDFAFARKDLLGQVWIQLGCDMDRVGAAEAIAHDRGRHPLRLSASGRNRFVLYSSPSASESLAHIFVSEPWVFRMVIEARKSGFRVLSESRALLSEIPSASETLVHEWDEAALWRGRPAPAISPDILADAVSGFGGRTRRMAWESLLTPMSRAELEAAVSSVIGKQMGSGSKMILNLVFSLPVGVVRHCLKRAGQYRSGEGERYYVAVLNVPDFDYLYRKASPEDRDVVEGGVARVYRHSAYHIDRLRADAKKPFEPNVCLVDMEALLGARGGGRRLRSMLDRKGQDFVLEEEIDYCRRIPIGAAEDFNAAITKALSDAGERYVDISVNETKIFGNED